MLTPKRVQNMMIGSDASTNPSGAKPSRRERCPSRKTQTSAPYEASSESAFIAIAFSGSSTERSRIAYVASTTPSSASGKSR